MSVRRLGLCLTASVARRPQNPLLSVLSCRPQSFSSSPARWYSSTDRLYQQTTEESEEGESGGVEENDRCVALHLFAICTLMVLD